METLKRVVLDTDVLVRLLRGRRVVQDVSAMQERAEIATTVINAFELYHGAYKSRESRQNIAATKGLLSTLSLLELDERAAERAAQTMVQLEAIGTPLEIRDILIGCVALVKGYAVLTSNRKHFERIPGLHVVEPSNIS